MLQPLGYRVPLAFERGYHQEFRANPSRIFQRPIYDVDGSFIMTPMENGIRVTSGVELTTRDAPSSLAQIHSAVSLARTVAEFGDAVAPVWRGARPSLPDSLPMIGAAPRHANLWLAFGHQHIGFATGPATGAAIAALICDKPTAFDTEPFSAARYL
jgi:D-amino-acid dehydrogenase